MLQVQAASCPYTSACTFSIPFPPSSLAADLALQFLGNKVNQCHW